MPRVYHRLDKVWTENWDNKMDSFGIDHNPLTKEAAVDPPSNQGNAPPQPPPPPPPPAAVLKQRNQIPRSITANEVARAAVAAPNTPPQVRRAVEQVVQQPASGDGQPPAQTSGLELSSALLSF